MFEPDQKIRLASELVPEISPGRLYGVSLDGGLTIYLDQVGEDLFLKIHNKDFPDASGEWKLNNSNVDEDWNGVPELIEELCPLLRPLGTESMSIEREPIDSRCR